MPRPCDEHYLKRTIELARTGSRNGEGGPFGALIVQRDEIIAEAWNQVLHCCDPTAHAEIGAIRAAARKLGRFHLDDCVLYASSEPCPMCLAATYWARIPRIVYANSRAEAAAIGFCDDALYAELARDCTARQLEMHHLPLDDASEMMREWSLKCDRQLY